MIDFGSVGAQLCVVGRTAFDTAMGAVAYGTAETLARSFPVAFRPVEPERQADAVIELPNRRRLPVLGAGARPVASIFCDVIWNETGDDAWSMLPADGMLYAWLLSDADFLPPGLVERLNRRAGVVLVPSPHRVEVAQRSGVLPPVTVLPIPLDFDALLVQPRPAMAARQWGFSALAGSVGALIDPAIARFRPARPPARDAERVIEQRLGRRGDAIGGIRRQVCPAYDAGFFSIFNAFMSHLVWQEREDRCHAVLPDWDVDRLIARQAQAGLPTRSFCYGQPGDGNLWLKLFQPLFGASEAEMQDEAFLWRHAEAPADRHNEAREPHLTYVRAYTLYRSAEFAGVRRQYHRVLGRHVRLRPEHAAEIEGFVAAFLDVPIRIAAHVRHPSHTVEQPGGRIAHTEAYVARVRDEVRRRGGDPDGEGWAVFVATDQAAVLDRFRAAFGARAVFYPQARRTRADEDQAFAALSAAEQNRDGHQLQHLVAADRASWSWRMAWEVVRDAYTMSRCQALLHVVSNVSTAVSYMNPDLEMIFCEA